MRKSRIIEGSCTRCGSLKHTLQEHNERMAEGRRKSAIWHKAMLIGNAKKRGKSLTFSDPVARSRAISKGLTKPETRNRISAIRKNMWANRTIEEKKAIGRKISESEKGKRLAPAHLANLRKANSAPRTEDHKRKLGECHKGKPPWNKGLTKFTNTSVMSTSRKQMGRIPDYNKYRAHYTGPKGRILMRSSWEVAYATYLDALWIDWQYEPRWFDIGSGNWTGHTYTPDFYLPAENKYIEIKGRLSDENRRKMAQFNKKFPLINLQLLMKPELIAMGLSL